MKSNSDHVPEFTIVGASPAGYSFALCLLYHCPYLDPTCIRIIEANTDWRKPGGPFWLSPNALRILDTLQTRAGDTLYERFQFQGYRAKQHNIRADSGRWIGAFPHGSKEIWGYDGLRIERGIVLKLLAEEVEMKRVKVDYDTSLREILGETSDCVEFVVRKGGSTGRTSILRSKRLIGADGAHSRTRNFVCGREMKPDYSGNFMIGGFVPRRTLQWTEAFKEAEANEEYSLSITDRKGTLLMIPVDHNAEILGIGRQWPMPEKDRAGWEALNSDKAELRRRMTSDASEWSEFPRSILEAAKQESPDSMIVWPMYLLPKLDRWISTGGKTVIIGDAAHTLIPAAAQGACQAIEDAWTLAKAYADGITETEDVELRRWEDRRIARIEKIAELSVQLMNVRLPPEEQAKLSADQLFPLDGTINERNDRLHWLYGLSEL